MNKCPKCGTELISSFTYPDMGILQTSRYCPACDEWFPKPKERWADGKRTARKPRSSDTKAN